jgi:hypothetical protein
MLRMPKGGIEVKENRDDFNEMMDAGAIFDDG